MITKFELKIEQIKQKFSSEKAHYLKVKPGNLRFNNDFAKIMDLEFSKYFKNICKVKFGLKDLDFQNN